MVGNEALGNADRGMDFDGDGNIVVENTSRGNGLGRIRLDDGNFLTVKNNTVIDNGGNGIEVESDGNTIKGNLVQGNGEAGILVEDTGNNNSIRKNTALDNKTFDLQDENVNCYNNIWNKISSIPAALSQMGSAASNSMFVPVQMSKKTG